MDLDGDRHCHRLEREPADPDARRGGGDHGAAADPPAPAIPLAWDRCRQRSGVHEPPDGGMVRPAGAGDRADPLTGLQVE